MPAECFTKFVTVALARSRDCITLICEAIIRDCPKPPLLLCVLSSESFLRRAIIIRTSYTAS
jgi:hypothetical protein